MVLALPASTICAQPISVNSARYISEANQAKIILNVSDSPKYRVFVLDKPDRLVVDLKNASAKRNLNQPSATHPLFSHVRTAQKTDSDLRLVVDLKQPISAKTHRLATKHVGNGQIVISLLDKQNQSVSVKAKPKATKLASKSAEKENQSDIIETSDKNKQSANKKRFIIAIDAGHGGDDPGARGPNGTKEKVVTLAIAKRLQAYINGQPGMKAKLVRKGDYYVGLRERMRLAKLNRADLFVSIHADAVNNPEVKGASVYTLSQHGASSEAARWLANNENAKEKIGGVDMDGKDPMLASVILDLSQTATQHASHTLASKVLRNFQGIGSLHYQAVQEAGFAVLKSPDIPSILVETAYISNPYDELNLMSKGYQNKIAYAIFKGIVNYVEQIEPSELNKMAKL
jgi:N-acetylmuramoyl-L-alanine amidase